MIGIVSRLGDIAKIDRFSIKADDIKSNSLYLGLEHIQSGGNIINCQLVERGELKSSKFRFTTQHLLYGKLRPYLAKIAAPDFDGICSTDIIPILPGPNVEKRFLLHFLRQDSMVAYADSLSSGANLPRLSPEQLGNFIISLPPLPEQKRIAAILDAADALRAKRRESIAQLDQLLQATFLEMFGDPVSNPKGWPEVDHLGDIADICSGITKGRRTADSVRPVPYLAVANVQDQRLKLDGVKVIEATEAEINRYKLEAGDLLLTEGGDPDKLGRGALWNGEIADCIHQNHIFRVRIHGKSYLPLYTSWLVGSARGKRYFLRSSKQTTGIASINMTQLKRFPLLKPPLDLQHRFARIVRSLENQKSLHRAHLTELDSLFASLQQRAFAGEL